MRDFNDISTVGCSIKSDRDYAHTHKRRIKPGHGKFIEGGEIGVFFDGVWDVYDMPGDKTDFTRWAIGVFADHRERWSGYRPNLRAEWRARDMLILEESR